MKFFQYFVKLIHVVAISRIKVSFKQPVIFLMACATAFGPNQVPTGFWSEVTYVKKTFKNVHFKKIIHVAISRNF